MTVVCTGSIAFDYILNFNGRFKDHILLDKAHIINLSFLVENLAKRRGGVAGNYAYNLALLGHPSAVLATGGDDAASYKTWLEGMGVDCHGLHLLEGFISATGFTTTDLDDNQITGYYGGAMLEAAKLGLDDTVSNPAAVIVGPNAPEAMFRLFKECRERGVKWVFDPAHQLPHMTADNLKEGARGAWIVVGNDYELQLIQDRTGLDMAGLLELSEIVVTTLGAQGSRIDTRSGSHTIPPAPVSMLADPTGAGDAYRSGLVAGLLRVLDIDTSGRIASLAGAYAVEHVGTMEHSYTLSAFAERYEQSFGAKFPKAFS